MKTLSHEACVGIYWWPCTTKFPILCAKYTQCFVNRFVDGCSLILCGAGGIFIYKYLLHLTKMRQDTFKKEKLYEEKHRL